MPPKKPGHRSPTSAEEPATDPSSGAEPLGDETLDFMRLLWSVDHGLQSASKRMKNELGITGPQRTVVRMVGQFPGVSAGRLAELLKLHPSTLTGILERLVTRGVLARRPDPEDARRALFELTKLGKLFNHLQVGTVESVVRQTLAHVPASDLQAARRVLQGLAAALADGGS